MKTLKKHGIEKMITYFLILVDLATLQRERMKIFVNQKRKRDFNLGYIKQIKTVKTDRVKKHSVSLFLYEWE